MPVWRVACLIFVLVVSSRLPFLGPGYGQDPDAWRYAEAAREMVRTGSYRASRLPGYPLPELTYAATAMWLEGETVPDPPPPGTGSLARPFSVIVALLSGVAAAAFGVVLMRLGCRDAVAGALALALTPVVYVQSTGAMDYVWALAFLMLALERAVAGKPVVAGALLGLAIGCRLTLGVMLLPLVIIAAAPESRAPAPLARSSPPALAQAVKLVSPALLVSGVVFLPVLLAHGMDFLTFVDQSKPWDEILKRMSFGVFGVVGSFGIFLVLASTRFLRSWPAVLADVPREHVVAWAIALMLLVAVFLRLPIEAGFLVPAVPFALLLLARVLPRPLFLLLCVILALSSFVSVVRSGPRPGPILWDHHQREERAAVVEELLEKGRRLGPDAVVVAGYLLPQLRVTRQERGYYEEVAARFIYLPALHEMRTYLAAGRPVYVVPGQEAFHALFYDYDLVAAGAEPLVLTSQSAP